MHKRFADDEAVVGRFVLLFFFVVAVLALVGVVTLVQWVFPVV